MNISHSYAFSGDFEKAERCIKKIIELKPEQPFVYQFLATVLKSQDKIEEMIKVINEGLKKNLINKKWEIQKKILSPVIMKDRQQIDSYREKILKGFEEMISSNIQLDYDNDQIVTPPLFEISYNDKDNLDINKKMVNAFKKVYKPLNHVHTIKPKENKKIKIGFVSAFFTDHTIGKLFKNLVFSLDLNSFDVVIYHSSKTKKGEIYQEFYNKIRKNLEMKSYQ